MNDDAKMVTVNRLLNVVAERYGLKNDIELAKKLRVSSCQVSLLRCRETAKRNGLSAISLAGRVVIFTDMSRDDIFKFGGLEIEQEKENQT